MAKVSIEDIEFVLSKYQGKTIDSALIKQVAGEVEETAEAEKDENADPKEKCKYKLVLIAIKSKGLPDGTELPITETPIYAVKVPESTKHTEVLSILYKAAYEHNNGKSGKKKPVKKVSEIFQFVKAKSFKPAKNPIQSFAKEPIIIVESDGLIPTS